MPRKKPVPPPLPLLAPFPDPVPYRPIPYPQLLEDFRVALALEYLCPDCFAKLNADYECAACGGDPLVDWVEDKHPR